MNSIIARVINWFSSLGRRSIEARHEAAETNAANANHYALADQMSARSAYTPSRRRTLRSRSRYEAENNSWYAGMLRTAANHIVGSGPSLKVECPENPEAADRLEAAWSRFADQVGLVEWLKTLVMTDWRDGECVAMRIDRGPDPDIDLGLRLYEADQLTDPWQSITDPFVEDGIRLHPKTGEPVEYHLLRQHPGDRLPASTLEGDWHSAEDVIHTFRRERPGQLRGIPRIAPALEDFIKQRRWEIATLRAAENAATLSTTIETTGPAVEPAKSPQDFLQIEMPDSGATFMPEGWRLSDRKPEYPATTHEMFTRANLTKSCRCLNMPYHVAAGTSRDSNFSSANLDLRLVWVGEVKSEQLRLELQAIKKLFRWFLEALVFGTGECAGLLDGLPAISRLKHSWTWDPIPTVDEVDSADAASARVSGGLSSLSDELAARGKDASAEIARSASDLGVDVPTYLALVRTKLFGVPTPAALPAPAGAPGLSPGQAPAGEFGSLSRRQFQNNTKAIRDVLQQAIDGTHSRVWALQLLQSLGLSQQRANALLDDALSDGQIDDPELSDAVAARAFRSLQAAYAGLRELTGPALVEIRADGSQRKFDILAYTGGKLNVEGFDRPVVVDLAGMETIGSVPILIDHTKSVETTLGNTTQAINSGTSLRLLGDVTGTSEKCLAVLQQHDKGQAWQASIGAAVEADEEIPAGQSVTVNGQTFIGPLIVARRSVLRETSVLPIGADGRTKVNLAAAAAFHVKGTVMSFEDWLKSLGLDLATLTDAAKVALQQQYDSMQTQQQQPADQAAAAGTASAAATVPATGATTQPRAQAGATLNLQASGQTADAEFAQQLLTRRQRLAADIRREDEIRTICAGYPRIEAQAIEAGWSAKEAELEVLKAKLKPKAPAGHIQASLSEAGDTVIEAACCLTGGLEQIEKRFDEKTLSAADKLFKGGIGLEELVAIHARANGWSGRSYRADAKNMLTAAFSTNNLSEILSNVANKFLLEGFTSVEDSWRQIAAIGSVNDFKAAPRYRLTGDLMYEKVGAGGQLKHGTLGEEIFSNKAETYGKILAIVRQDFVNDDMGALTAVPKRLGRGGHLKINDVFWTEFFTNHDEFFPEDGSRKNCQTGTATALSIDSLTAAETIFLDKVDPDGMPLAIEPKILLVPNALNTKATQYTRDTEIRDTNGSKQYTTSNPHAGKFRPVRSSYLGNAKYGNSTLAWYLLADPQDLPLIEIVFLNGQQTPVVEQADADFSTLGVQMRGYHDFGVAKQDYRAGVKSKGQA